MTSAAASPIVIERFWAKVDRSRGDSACWLWMAGCFEDGYGAFQPRHGRSVRAHRFSWEIAFDAIPVGLFVCHKCDNPRCVNPAHLFLGDIATNNADKMAKGRFKPLRGEANGYHVLTQLQVNSIRALKRQGVKQRDIARRIGASESLVSLIVNNKIWRDS